MIRMNDTLKELLSGIFLYGAAVQVTGIWLVQEKLMYSTGLWIGILMSAAAVIHMSHTIESSLDFEAEKAASHMWKAYGLRLAVCGIIMGITFYFKLGNAVMVLLGILSIKVGAYLQPFTHKFIFKKSNM